jgi:hypothetical protein
MCLYLRLLKCFYKTVCNLERIKRLSEVTNFFEKKKMLFRDSLAPASSVLADYLNIQHLVLKGERGSEFV